MFATSVIVVVVVVTTMEVLLRRPGSCMQVVTVVVQEIRIRREWRHSFSRRSQLIGSKAMVCKLVVEDKGLFLNHVMVRGG